MGSSVDPTQKPNLITNYVACFPRSGYYVREALPQAITNYELLYDNPEYHPPPIFLPCLVIPSLVSSWVAIPT